MKMIDVSKMNRIDEKVFLLIPLFENKDTRIKSKNFPLSFPLRTRKRSGTPFSICERSTPLLCSARENLTK